MALLIKPGRDAAENWMTAIAAEIPDLDMRVWPEAGNRDEVLYIIANQLPPGEFSTFPNLRFVASTSAGVDRLLTDPDFPAHVPIVRSINAQRTATMCAWVCYHVIRQHRHFDRYRENQARKVWEHLSYPPPDEVGIGVMGLGTLGGTAARTLKGFMYDVAGWSRSPKDMEGIRCFSGPDAFPEFLRRSDILLSILPGTAETDNLLNRETLALLPQGAYILNCGRGNLIDDDALIDAMDAGHISGAALDAFRTEPLPEDHPYWRHPKVTLTPHYSSNGSAKYGVGVVIDNIRRDRAGEPLADIVDKAAGY
ncbi:MAG: glyoxylate/hydroxypyruvate reductase A [Alphaproteobacteria bacterium]|nr:glyoxylate/hydroxypyruvate reductase A [Alphaproteobacteria bacterium]